MADMLLLEPPGIAEARQLFESSLTAQRHRLRFQSLLPYFQSNCTLRSIAREFNLTYRMVCEIDRRYFEPVISMGARQRLHQREQQRRRRELQQIRKSLSEESKHRIIAEAAENAGLDVELLAQHKRGTPRLMRNFIQIHGYTCAIYGANYASDWPAVKILKCTNECVRAHIVVTSRKGTGIRKVFVIPTSVLAPHFKGREVRLQFPLSGLAQGWFDTGMFENAWHLLCETNIAHQSQ